MVIVGITGGIGHGKSALAEAFAAIEPRSVRFESFELVAEVINAWQARSTDLPNPHKLNQVNDWLDLLQPILRQVVHLEAPANVMQFGPDDIVAHPELYEKLFQYLAAVRQDRSLATTPISITNKVRYRAILQWLGGYGEVRIAKGIWYNELLRRAHAAASRGMQLCIISGVRFVSDAKIVCAAGGYVAHIVRPLIGEQDIDDPTERERRQIKANTTIINNAGLSELRSIAQYLYNDIKLGKLKAYYVASDTLTPTNGGPDLYNSLPDSS